MTESTRQVPLPEELCAVAEAKFGQQFHSLEELLRFLLHELVNSDAAAYDEAEEKLVEERLRELGYI